MRALTFTELSRDDFEAFSARAAHGNFQQTVMAADLRKRNGTATRFVGVRDGAEIVAAALLETHGSGLATFCTVHDGPLCDYDDRELTTFFLDHLAAYAKRLHAVHLDITPEQPYRVLGADGEPIAGDPASNPDNAMIANITAAHMDHGGFTRGYTAVPRWRFVKDLTGIASAQQLLASFSKRTQWSVKRARSMGVVVREVGEDQFGVFARIEQQTAERRRFAFRGEQYFHDFARAFGDRAHFMIAYIDTARYLESMQRKADDLRSLVESISAKMQARETTKLRRRYNEESSNLAAADKRLQAARELATRGALLPAACSLFVEHPNEVVYLFSGSLEEYKPFYASALIQHEAMLRLCVEQGITRYNFYGIDGVFDDPNSEGHGVLEFKQGFNGYVEELPGEFTLPVSRVRCAVKRIAQKVIGG